MAVSGVRSSPFLPELPPEAARIGLSVTADLRSAVSWATAVRYVRILATTGRGCLKDRGLWRQG
jgi:hypothetical protein